MTQTITLTFSESVENHRGNQVLGKIADKGFNLDDIKIVRNRQISFH